MTNFDWNGNEKNDLFDEYMDYKVSDEFNESNKNHKKSNVSTNIPLWKIIFVLLMCSFCFVIPFLVDEVGFLYGILLIGVSIIGYKILQ